MHVLSLCCRHTADAFYCAQCVTGGSERVCIIDDEECVVHGKMRCSGDLVKQTEDGLLIYVGRQDDMIKRHGKRIHLHEIEQV